MITLALNESEQLKLIEVLSKNEDEMARSIINKINYASHVFMKTESSHFERVNSNEYIKNNHLNIS